MAEKLTFISVRMTIFLKLMVFIIICLHQKKSNNEICIIRTQFDTLTECYKQEQIDLMDFLRS